MKFWITLVGGVILLTALSTVAIVMNPDLVQQPETQSEETPTGPLPRAVASETEIELEDVPQHTVGEHTFSIKNAGEADLWIAASVPNCQCAKLELTSGDEYIKVTAVDKQWKSEVSPDLPRESDFGYYVTVPPGEEAKLLMTWDTKTKQGRSSVFAEVRTNDPDQEAIRFLAKLRIAEDILTSVGTVDFRSIKGGEPAEETILVYSKTRDDVNVTDLKTSSKSIQARVEKPDAQELEIVEAKSGVKVVVATDGTLPEGYFSEEVRFVGSGGPSTKDFKLRVGGIVSGLMNIEPKFIDFGVVSDRTRSKRNVKIFARGLQDGQKLVIGEVSPDYLTTKLTQDAKFPTLWDLEVNVKEGVKLGPFRGNISIKDDAGVKRLNIPTKGSVKS